ESADVEPALVLGNSPYDLIGSGGHLVHWEVRGESWNGKSCHPAWGACHAEPDRSAARRPSRVVESEGIDMGHHHWWRRSVFLRPRAGGSARIDDDGVLARLPSNICP